MKCNCNWLAIAILAAFAVIFVTDFLIHGVWLAPTYEATKELWRPEAERMSNMPWMILGQAIVAVAFTTIYALFVAEKRSMQSTLLYAICVALLVIGGQVIMYAVQPYPGSLVVKWCLACLVQLSLVGAVISFVYKS